MRPTALATKWVCCSCGRRRPRRKVVRPALDDVHDSLDLARRKLNHDLADPPVPGNKAESCRDRFGHAMLCGPISPDAIESDFVRIGGGALCRAQGCLGTEPRKSARGSVREEPALRRTAAACALEGSMRFVVIIVAVLMILGLAAGPLGSFPRKRGPTQPQLQPRLWALLR